MPKMSKKTDPIRMTFRADCIIGGVCCTALSCFGMWLMGKRWFHSESFDQYDATVFWGSFAIGVFGILFLGVKIEWKFCIDGQATRRRLCWGYPFYTTECLITAKPTFSVRKVTNWGRSVEDYYYVYVLDKKTDYEVPVHGFGIEDDAIACQKRLRDFYNTRQGKGIVSS